MRDRLKEGEKKKGGRETEMGKIRQSERLRETKDHRKRERENWDEGEVLGEGKGSLVLSNNKIMMKNNFLHKFLAWYLSEVH